MNKSENDDDDDNDDDDEPAASVPRLPKSFCNTNSMAFLFFFSYLWIFFLLRLQPEQLSKLLELLGHELQLTLTVFFLVWGVAF